MSPVAALALLLLQDAQDPAPVLLDGIAVQADGEVVTLSDLERSWKEAFERQKPSSREEELQVRGLILVRDWEDALERQQGRELGIDPDLVKRNNQLWMRREREESGLSSFLQGIESSGRDVFQAEADRADDVYRSLFRSTVVGREVPGRRPTVDRFVRPGQLHFVYEENRDKLAPVQVQLQVLVVPAQAAGGPDQALRTCEEARASISAGEDFASLVAEYGADLRETGGLTPLLPLERITDERLRGWAGRVGIGALSESMPILGRSGEPEPALGYQLVRLVDRQAPPVPEFDEQALQSNLREYLLRNQEQRLVEISRRRLRGQSYGWVNPYLRPLVEGPPKDTPALEGEAGAGAPR
jgi:hypothetical protein